MAYTNLSDMTANIRPDVPGCLDAVILSAIQRAAVEFCRKSHYWEMDLDPIYAINGVATYEVFTYTDQDLILVARVLGPDGLLQETTLREMDSMYPNWRANQGVPVFWMMDSPRYIRFYPEPDTNADGNQYNIRAIVTPTSSSTVIEDFIYENFHYAIEAGAKAILCAMPGKTWSNPGLVPYYREQFDIGIMDASAQRVSSYANAKLQVRPVPFGGALGN